MRPVGKPGEGVVGTGIRCRDIEKPALSAIEPRGGQLDWTLCDSNRRRRRRRCRHRRPSGPQPSQGCHRQIDPLSNLDNLPYRLLHSRLSDDPSIGPRLEDTPPRRHFVKRFRDIFLDTVRVFFLCRIYGFDVLCVHLRCELIIYQLKVFHPIQIYRTKVWRSK